MLSRINDAINGKLIQFRERFELLPYGVQAVLVLGVLAAVVTIGVWVGAWPVGQHRVPFPKK